MKKVVSLMLVALGGAVTGAWGAQPLPIGCLIQPEQVSDVGSPVAGIVQSMLVERGDSVRKGQAIAVLRNNTDRASVTVARGRAQTKAEERAASANVAFTTQRLARVQKLYERKLITAQTYDQFVAEAEVAQQKLAQAKEQQHTSANEVGVAEARLAERTIRSPFDGMIAERYVSAGERVELQPLVRVAKVGLLRIEVIMPSALFGSVVAGSVARVTPEMPGAAALRAKVTLVDKILDAASGTFRVRLELPNPDTSIPAGLRCKVDFAAETGASKIAPKKGGTDKSLNPAAFKTDSELSIPRTADAPPRKVM